MGRETWTDEFIEFFKSVYARRGRDVDCISEMRERYRSQYPALVTNQLTRLRLKRKPEFDEVREAYIEKVRAEVSQRNRHLLVRSADLNARVVEQLLESQEEYLYKVQDLDRNDKDYEKEKFSLLRVITSLQKEINSFSGLDIQSGINDYTEKLLRRKLIEEKDANWIRNMLMGGAGVGDGKFEDRKEAPPKISLIEDDDEN
jgi:hypothetical protein